MLKDSLQNEIVVKTREGGFKLLKNGQLGELIGDQVMIREDSLVKHTPVNVRAPIVAPANFYFSVDDEEDVQQEKKTAMSDKNLAIKNFIDQAAEAITRQVDWIKAQPAEKNLHSIIISRFRNIRGLAATMEAIQKPVAFGGTNSTREQTDKIIELIESASSAVEEVIRTGNVPLVEQHSGPNITGRKTSDETVSQGHSRQSSYAANQHTAPSLPRFDQLGYQPENNDELSSAWHQAIGPVEEIKKLTLENFRRLGKDPHEAAWRVAEKIDLLEDESTMKKAEGIKAWQSSAVYGLYLLIGAASMAEKTAVENIIAKRKQARQSYLSKEEFDAVADLNKRLSY